MQVDMNDIPNGNVYRINYNDSRGYEREAFVDRPDLVDKLEEISASGTLNFVKIEE